MPRSRGRPTGRGRQKPRPSRTARRQPPAGPRLTWEALAVREGRDLLRDPTTRRPDAELIASQVLASQWATAAPGGPDPVRHGVELLVRHVQAQPTNAGRALLAACRLVVDDDARALLDDALDGSDLPPWATAPPLEPTRAGIGREPSGGEAIGRRSPSCATPATTPT